MADNDAQQQQQPPAPHAAPVQQQPGQEPQQPLNNLSQQFLDLLYQLQRATPTAPANNNTLITSSASTIPPDALIDFTTKTARRIEYATDKGLDDKYGGEPAKWSPFSRDIKLKLAQLGITGGVFTVGGIDLFTKAGTLTTAQVRAHCIPYISGDQRLTRAAQNNILAMNFLETSLTSSMRARLIPFKTEFEITFPDPDHPGSTLTVPSAASYFKQLHDLITLASSQRIILLKTQARESDRLMKASNGDVGAYIAAFQEIYDELTCLNSTLDDSVVHFFKGAQVSANAVFNKWCATKHEEWIDSEGYLFCGRDGTLYCGYDRVKALLMSKYKNMVHSGTWTTTATAATSSIADNAEFVALQAEVAALKGGLQAATPSSLRRNKPSPRSQARRSAPSTASPASKTRNKKDRSNRSRQKKEEAWRKIAPKPGEPTSKVVDGWSCIWCPYHQAWGAHLPDKCRKGLEQREAASNAHKVKHQASAALAQLADLSRFE